MARGGQAEGASAVPFCRHCGIAMGEQDRFCRACGAVETPALGAVGRAPVAPPQGTTARAPAMFIAGQALAMIGSMMLAVGPFLPWVQAFLLTGLSVSGLQKTGNEAFLLVGLGVIGLVLGVVAVASGHYGVTWGSVVVGLIAFGLSVLYVRGLHAELRTAMAQGETDIALGAGVYICFFGGMMATVGAFIGGIAAATIKR